MIGLFCLKNNSAVKRMKKFNKLHNALTHHSLTYNPPEIKYKQTRDKVEKIEQNKGKIKQIIDSKVSFYPQSVV